MFNALSWLTFNETLTNDFLWLCPPADKKYSYNCIIIGDIFFAHLLAFLSYVFLKLELVLLRLYSHNKLQLVVAVLE